MIDIEHLRMVKSNKIVLEINYRIIISFYITYIFVKTVFLRRMKPKSYEKADEHLTADVEGFFLLVLVSLEQTQSTLNYTCYCVRSYDLKYHMIDYKAFEFENVRPSKIYSHVNLYLKIFTLKYDGR